MNSPAIQRYLYPCGSELRLDANGLLVGSPGSLWQSALIGLDGVAQLPGGILLAEGGMGKTVFMAQLRDVLAGRPVIFLKLGEYVDDPTTFNADLAAQLDSASGDDSRTVVLDGLDEAPELAGTIIRKLRQLPDSTAVWISSRDIPQVRAIQTERPELKSFGLAPLSEADVCALAVQQGADGEQFLQAATRQGVIPICAKPLGCQLAVSVFGENGLVGVAQLDLWRRGIERLCDETPSPTRQLGRGSPFSLRQIVDCASWISVCLVLSENHFVWTGGESHCPHLSLKLSDLCSEQFPADLVRTALERGVFSPLGDGRIRFSHAVYGDYLAALGLASFIAAQHWLPLLLNGQRDSVFPQRAGVAVWLAAHNAGLLEELSGIQPELLLASVDAVQAIGPDTLCAALLDRADGLSYRQLQDAPIRSNLHRLDSARTRSLLEECLLSPGATSAAIELATAITEECGYAELADVLAGRVLDTDLSTRERIEAGYAVWRLGNEGAKGRLKALLPIDPSEDPDDGLRGVVLRACWPVHLTPGELLPHLTFPRRPNSYGAYAGFLLEDLPASLESSLDEGNAAVFLAWAVERVGRHDPFDHLGGLARTIYTLCWQWAGVVDAVTTLLAEGYLKALSEYRVPFLQEEYVDETISFPLLSKEDVLRDTAGRFAVLRALLTAGQIAERDLMHIAYNDFPLYTEEDLPALFDHVISDPSGALAEQWAVCICAVLVRGGLDAYADRVSQLHALRPDLIDDCQAIRADVETTARRTQEMEQKWAREQAVRKKDSLDRQQEIDDDIKDALHTPDLKPEVFANLSFWLNSENGTPSIGPVNMQLSSGWAKLTEDERNSLLDLAQRYLAETKIEATEPKHHQYGVARALTALRLLRPGAYAGLSRDVWQRCAVELLKAAMHDNMDMLDPLFDTLATEFPGVATKALLAVIGQELQSEHVFIIGKWGSRLTDDQAQALLTVAEGLGAGDPHCFTLVDELAEHGKDGLVRHYLATLFCDGWGSHPEPEFHKLRRLAFVLSPVSYIGQLLDALAAAPSWGTQWMEATISVGDVAFFNALTSCEVSDIASLYIWLHRQYPAATRPEHADAYTPGPLDTVHMLKDRVVNYLTESGRNGSATVLEEIVKHFPEDTWLRSCVLDARKAEQRSALPVLSASEIQKLRTQKGASRRLISSGHDLLDLVTSSLADYQQHLQGDTPAIGDLWNVADSITPKTEEDLSDHLARYFRLTLTGGIVINREVQIRRKLFRDGEPGSRTDLWIQATDGAGEILTLCVEVKCNWNASAETAIAEQLIGKYMSGGTASAGILVLGWFECASWDGSDGRLGRSTATWSDTGAALAELQEQAALQQTDGNNVLAIVLDCALR